MSNLANRQQAAQIERRRSGRLLIEIPVGFRTVSGLRQCNMANISDTGAMLEMDRPPVVGISGWLVMGEEELYCTIVWTNERSCGVEFERALGSQALDKIAGKQTRESGPAANRGRIPMGRKRTPFIRRSN